MANDFVVTADGSHSRQAIDWLPVILWGVVIFSMSTSTFSALNTSSFIEPMLGWLFPLASKETITVLHALVRKSAHFTEYGVLLWLLLRGPMPGRTPSLYDVALDSTGALFSHFLNLAIAELA